MTVGCLNLGLWVPWNTNPVAVAASLDVEPLRMVPYPVTAFDPRHAHRPTDILLPAIQPGAFFAP